MSASKKIRKLQILLDQKLSASDLIELDEIRQEVEKLEQTALLMSCMEMAGVDNWDGTTYEVMKEWYPEEYKRLFGDD